MQLGLGVAAGPDPSPLAGLARELEGLGYHSVWSNDTPAGEGLLMLDAWARNSSAIDLGVGVMALDRHPPAAIAERVAELGLPRERLYLGIGAGFNSRPLGAVRTGVAELRRLLPEVRLLVAAMGPKMCSLAGQVADGVLLNWMTPERAAWARQLVEDGARGAGRDPSGVIVCGYVRSAIGPDAAGRLDRESGGYMQLPHYARHFEAQGVAPRQVGIAVEDPDELPLRVTDYGALNLAVVRALSEPTMEGVMAIARAAAAAIS